MDYLTVGLLVLIVALFVLTLCLGWKLYTRPMVTKRPPAIPILAPAPPPAFVPCEVKHFIFKRTDETGAEVQQDVWRHPHCESLAYADLTDEAQAASFLGGHPEPGWQHTETRGEPHLVKA